MHTLSLLHCVAVAIVAHSLTSSPTLSPSSTLSHRLPPSPSPSLSPSWIYLFPLLSYSKDRHCNLVSLSLSTLTQPYMFSIEIIKRFCIIEGPEMVQDFAKMELQEIQDNIRS